MNAVEEYLREKVADWYVDAMTKMRVYGTLDPDEIARIDAEGFKWRGIAPDGIDVESEA